MPRVFDNIAQSLLPTPRDNRLMRSGVNDEQLSDAVKSLREENQLTYAEDGAKQHEPKIICSMGLRAE